MSTTSNSQDDTSLERTIISNDEALSMTRNRQVPPKKKISTACNGCKRRKTRCSGQFPCTQCVSRGTITDCLIDSTTDLRRKGVSEKRLDDLENDRLLLDGMIETIKNSDDGQLQMLADLIRRDISKPDLASHIKYTVQQSDATRTSMGSPPVRRPSTASRHKPTGSIHDLLNHDEDEMTGGGGSSSITYASSPDYILQGEDRVQQRS